MPRYRRYTKTIIKAPKKRWNKGIVSMYPGASENGWIQTAHYHNQIYGICANKADNTIPTPGILKVKHIKVYGQMAIYNPSELVDLAPGIPVLVEVIIMYLPQVTFENASGAVDDSARNNYIETIITDHPEWIMNRRTLKGDVILGLESNTFPIYFSMGSGQLQRNLSSGDRLACIVRINSTVQVNPAFRLWYNIDASFASTFN